MLRSGIMSRNIWSYLAIAMGIVLLSTVGLVLAQEGSPPVPGAAAGAPPQPGIFEMLFPLILIFGIFYFLMIRPQTKKMKKHQEMLGELKKGDEIVTNSGFLGKISGMTDKVVTVDLGGNCKVKMMKSHIAQVVDNSNPTTQS